MAVTRAVSHPSRREPVCRGPDTLGSTGSLWRRRVRVLDPAAGRVLEPDGRPRARSRRADFDLNPTRPCHDSSLPASLDAPV